MAVVLALVLSSVIGVSAAHARSSTLLLSASDSNEGINPSVDAVGPVNQPQSGELDGPQSGEPEHPQSEESQGTGADDPQSESADSSVLTLLAAPMSATVISTQVINMSNAIKNWKPGFILSQEALYTSSRMSEAQIRTFIETVGASCRTTATNKCLKDQSVGRLSLRSKFDGLGYGCKPLSLTASSSKSWTAVKAVADACGLNPEVLLVFIQKESSGFTRALTAARWDKMMGMGCPDNKPCDTQYAGFINQLYYGADALTSYRYRDFPFNVAARTKKPVAVNNSSTYGASCGTQTFVMENQATASLYTYNPAVPTQTALNSWPGTSGLQCDSYGQRNVYMMMVQWFPASMQDHPVLVTTGWQFTNGSWYYFNPDGSMATGWVNDAGKWYYMSPSGAMQTGWVFLGGKWYFLGPSGDMQTGWLTQGKVRYYLTSTGAMASGWRQIQGSRYYFDANGALQSGRWLTVGNNMYYLGSDGAAQTGWVTVDGARRYFAADGALQTGWITADGARYYLANDGTARTGWLDISGSRYFMAGNGAMQTGWLKQNATWFYLSSSGAMQTGWQLVGSTWYRLAPNGEMLTGWQNVGGRKYFLTDSGAMKTGWLKQERDWYFLDSSGAMQTGWRSLNGEWYSLAPTGVIRTGWFLDGKTWYYLGKGGAMVTGRQTIDGRASNFSASGAWLGYAG